MESNEDSLESVRFVQLQERLLRTLIDLQHPSAVSFDTQDNDDATAALDKQRPQLVASQPAPTHRNAMDKMRPSPNTKLPRMKPAETAGPAIPSALQEPLSHSHFAPIKMAAFHAFSPGFDGDTQPMPSQVYKDYNKSMMQEARYPAVSMDATTDNASVYADTQGEANAGQVDLVSLWQEPDYQEISSDDESGDEKTGGNETQDLLSSVTRPPFPKTPAMAGQKRTYRGEPVSATSTKTPGSGLSAFCGLGDGNAMSVTQMFQATQTPSSPMQEMGIVDAIFTRPSPNMRQSSPALNLSSPTKTPAGHLRATTEPRDMYMSMKESQEERKRRLLEARRLASRSSSGIARGMDEEDDDDDDEDEDSAQIRQARKIEHARISSNALHAWNRITAPARPDSRSRIETHEIPETPAVSHARLDRKQKEALNFEDELLQGHDDESVDEYDEFAQDIRPSQRQGAASPSRETEVDEYAEPVVRLGSQPVAQHVNEDGQGDLEDVTVADSQPHRQDTRRAPVLSEPSSMASIVPGSQSPAAPYQTQDRDKEASLANVQPVQTEGEQHGIDREVVNNDQQRLPSSPPQLSAAHEQSHNAMSMSPLKISNGGEGSPQLPGVDSNSLSGNTSLRPTPHQQSSTIPETDPVESTNRRNGEISAPFAIAETTVKQVAPRESNNTSLFETAMTHFSGSSARHSGLSQARSSRQVSESPRKAAGIRKFADISTGPTPPDAVSSVDVDFDILNRDDQDFLNAVSSPASEPVTKRPRGYGRTSRRVNNYRLSVGSSPVQNHAVSHEQSSSNVVIGDADQPPSGVHTIRRGSILVDRLASPSKETVSKEQAEASRSSPEQMQELLKKNNSSNQQETHNASNELPSPERRMQNLGNTGTQVVLPGTMVKGTEPANNVVVKGKLVRPKQRVYGKSVTRQAASNVVPRRTPQEIVESPMSISKPAKASAVQSRTTAQSATRLPPATAAPSITNAWESAEPRGELTSSYNDALGIVKDIVCPDRVFALFKGTGQAYYPATCLGATTLDGHKLRIRFDDGTTTQLEPMFVRRLEFRRGDQVKVDLPGLRSKVYLVLDLSNKIHQPSQEAFPKTDIHGYTTLQLTPKDRDSTLSQAAAGQAATLSIPSTHIYLTQTMWIRFDDRTPVPNLSVPATPGSRSRRPALPSAPTLTRTEFATPAINGDDKYRAAKTAEKDRVLALIQEHGGLLLDNGFDELFNVVEVADTGHESPNKSNHRPSPAPTDDGTDALDALTLTPKAKSLGFVALIADKHSRRAKYVQALALSLPCLSPRWIIDSVTSGSAVPWPKYLLPAGESVYLFGAIRSRTLEPFDVAEAKLAEVFQSRKKLLHGGRVLLVGQGGKAKWESRKAYAFLTIALGATAVRRVAGLPAAKHIIEQEEGSWTWVYVDGSVEEAEQLLFGGSGDDAATAAAAAAAAKAPSKKRKRAGGVPGDSKEKMVAGNGTVKIVGDEFVVQSLILGALIEE
ncbi:hypothetical protein MBLNU459_g3182t2 [Dothideomycetes sp. NU459]